MKATSGYPKVPEITIYFWIAKLLTTAMGEATSDYLVYHMNPYLAVVLGGIGTVVALLLQLAVQRYIAWVYWLVVIMVSIFGTMAADVTHVVLGIPYVITTPFFAISLAVIFILWYRVEKTLSIHSIYTRSRELFYWATVMATFVLGTAAGDMTAFSFHLGFFRAGVFFAAVFAMPALAYMGFGLNKITAFWFAYVMTRPLGASFADLFGMPRRIGGLGYGKGLVSLVLTSAIVVVVGYLSVSKIDVQRAPSGPS